MKMKEMSSYLLPREKALKYGIDSLNDVELMAIVLGSGIVGVNVLDLSNNILNHIEGLSNLDVCDLECLKEIRGIGKNKVLLLQAIIQLQKRMVESKVKDLVFENNPEDLYESFKVRFMNEKQEHFVVICLNGNKEVIDYKTIFKGTIDFAMVHPREVVSYLTSQGAKRFIILHNHPSNNVIPSEMDISLTNDFQVIGQLIGIPMDDHVIIGIDDYYSFKRDFIRVNEKEDRLIREKIQKLL